MSEYIGARISLISKREIRYVGTLVEINSEDATVSLENVTSFGTEGRKNDPAEEIAANSSTYEYIVFRGSDVKDLRIEEAPKENKPAPQVPNDPAILGSSRPPNHQQPPSQQPPPAHQQSAFQGPPYGQYPPYGQRFGPPGGFPVGPGGPGNQHGFPQFPGPPGPYGPPPGWYPPPGQGFPQHPGPGPGPPVGPGPPGHVGRSAGPHGIPSEKQELSAEQLEPAQLGTHADSPAPPESAARGPPSTAKTKADSATTAATAADRAAKKDVSTSQKANRIVPAVPLAGAATPQPRTMASVAAQVAPAGGAQPKSQPPQAQYSAAAASAAVAAAMAKLQPQKNVANHGDGVDHITKKVHDLRTEEHGHRGRGYGTGAPRGSRGGRGRGSGREFAQGSRKVEVPSEDFDFQSSNAKFNKQDLVKEAIASGSPLGTPDERTDALNGDAAHQAGSNGTAEAEGKSDDVVIPPAAAIYNKSTSFFDNLSSDAKEKGENNNAVKRPGGQDFRREERQKNLETFGQGSVDNFRGGYRGRGRGYRGRGRGGSGPRGRGVGTQAAA